MRPGKIEIMPMTLWLDLLYAIMPPTGALLLGAGAGTGTWVQWLQRRALQHVALVEGDDVQFRHLLSHLAEQSGWGLHREVVAPSTSEAPFHRASNPAEGGLLTPEQLQSFWPNLHTMQIQTPQSTTTLDALLAEAQQNVNWLMVDCLPAAPLLQTACDSMGQLDVLLVRVVVDETFSAEPAARHSEANALLETAGFRCVHVQPERHPALAHALYIRDIQQILHKMSESLAVQAATEQQLQLLRAQHAAHLAEANHQIQALQSELTVTRERAANAIAAQSATQQQLQSLQTQYASLQDEAANLQELQHREFSLVESQMERLHERLLREINT